MLSLTPKTHDDRHFAGLDLPDPVALLAGPRAEPDPSARRSPCRKLIVTDDRRRIGLARSGFQLARPGAIAGIPVDLEHSPVALAHGVELFLRDEHAALVLTRPGRADREPPVRSQKTVEQCRVVARTIRKARPSTVALAARHLWLSDSFATVVAPVIAETSDEVEIGGAGIDLCSADGLSAWSLFVALNAGSQTYACVEEAQASLAA